MELTAQFYLIYPFGLVDHGLFELKEKWEMHFKDHPLVIVSIDEAGILISATTLQGFLLNHILRSPTRILMRVAEFKARDFPKLFQKISKIPWKNLMIGQAPEVETAATNSRLFDSRKIEKAVQDGILESYRKQPVKKKYLEHLEANKNKNLPKIYYRAVDDHITLSIDTTGELLHKRGDKIFTGLAPIRESLATLLLLATTKNLSENNYTLIDPMAGSGTFLIEAHDYFSVNTDRDFAYQHTPLWIDEGQKKKILEALTSSDSTLFSSFRGFDINPDIVALAKKNRGERNIQFESFDLFKESPVTPGKNIVVINPPYGLRVGEKSEINSEYYKKIIEMSKVKFSPVRLGIIIPEDYKYIPKKEELVERIPFKNGGLSVAYYLFKLPYKNGVKF